MEFTVEAYILFVLAQIVTAAAIWGGLRADIKNIHSAMLHNEKAISDAHSRIDTILMRKLDL